MYTNIGETNARRIISSNVATVPMMKGKIYKFSEISDGELLTDGSIQKTYHGYRDTTFKICEYRL